MHTGRMNSLQRSRQRLGRFTCKEAKEHHTLLEATSSWWGEAWEGFSLGRNQPPQHLDFRFLASRTVRQQTSAEATQS